VSADRPGPGLRLPPMAERFARLEAQLESITGLWGTAGGATFSFSGSHYSLEGSPALPKPVQRPHPPVLVGGGGQHRTPRLAAKFADEYNIPFASVEVSAAAFGRVGEACQE